MDKFECCGRSEAWHLARAAVADWATKHPYAAWCLKVFRGGQIAHQDLVNTIARAIDMHTAIRAARREVPVAPSVPVEKGA